MYVGDPILNIITIIVVVEYFIANSYLNIEIHLTWSY